MRQEPDVSVPADALSLSELLTRYVSGQAARFEDGAFAPDLGSEVSLHDVAGAAQAIDPRLAWDEAVAALTVGGALPSGSLPAPCSAPTGRRWWPRKSRPSTWPFVPVTSRRWCAISVCCWAALGTARRTLLRARSFRSDALVEWAEKIAAKSLPQTLLGAGVLRLTQEFDRASHLLRGVEKAPAEWRAACLNEEASLAWHAGRRNEATDLWQARGDHNHLPTLFNLGMAALFLGRPSEARAPLSQAVSRLPEDNSWHHLARLYLTLAEMRGA